MDLTELPFLSPTDFGQIWRSRSTQPRVAKRYGLSSEQIEQIYAAVHAYGGGNGEAIAYERCLRLLYPPGTRFRLDRELDSDSASMRGAPGPGDEGVLESFDSRPKLFIRWDSSGECFPLVPGTDEFSVVALPAG